MSRPRKPFGAVHPGRLPATMIKVLAAEMSDPSRLRRGKQYAKDGSVLDIIVEPGVVTCEVQGSRPTPYLAAVHVTPGDGMPLRRDVSCSCTCPDDDNWDDHICKHVVATLFTLSNEFLIEPELLDVWRGVDADATLRRADDGADDDHDNDEHDGTPTSGPRRHLRLVRDDGADATTAPARVRPDPLEGELSLPTGAALPEIPVLEPADLRSPPDHDLAAALRDALTHVRIDWD